MLNLISVQWCMIFISLHLGFGIGAIANDMQMNSCCVFNSTLCKELICVEIFIFFKNSSNKEQERFHRSLAMMFTCFNGHKAADV